MSPAPSAEQQTRHERFERVWGNRPGWGALSAVNHTTVGLRFLVTGLVFFLIGGLLAMLIRTQLALPGQEIIGADLYNQLFTMHGTVMMFLFAIPVLEGAAMYLIPKMIGARDLVFPRLSALGYFCYLFGGLIILSSLFLQIAPASGWFMYTPLSSSEFSPGMGSDFWLLGITFVEISAISAGVELVVSILRSRAPGISLQRMPLFAWYILAMALMIIFGFPPLILGSVLLELERAAGWVFFSVEGGGDPLLWQHLFWLFGHPEVYIIFLPAAGIVSTLIPVFAGRPIIGYRWVVVAIIMMGFVSFGLWVHHMFTVGIPQMAQAFFSVASMLVAIPTAIQIFVWLATLWAGKVRFHLPMLWIMGFLIVFVCGGLTGVMLALVPFNWQVHDTHFVVAHMHYVLVGGMLFPLVAGLYYWLPHVSGRMPSDSMGRWGFWLFFAGFNMTFLLMHLTGLLGMPRRVYTYEAGLGWDWLNLLSSLGGFVMAIGVATVILDIVLHFRFGRKADPNPWQADTLEWAIPMPVNAYNFASIPEIRSRHPLWDQPELMQTIPAGEHRLGMIEDGRRDTIGSDAISGEAREVMHLPGNAWEPLVTAALLAGVCLSLLLKTYSLAIIFTLLVLVACLRWSWVNGLHPRMAPRDRTGGLPLHSRTIDGPGRWGMIVALMADGTLFASLIFGWLYLWPVAPDWRMPEQSPLSVWGLLGSGLLLAAATGLWWRQARGAVSMGGLLLVAGVGLAHCVALVVTTFDAGLRPGHTAHDSILAVVLAYLIFHSGLTTLLTGLQVMRVRYGYTSRTLPYELRVLDPLWGYTVGVYWISIAVFLAMPAAFGGGA
ncbi:cytochrome c oxidase subunit I [Marinobacter sp.]|uniref:cytochrome c oxidase subunit I n=1 Tax=Marinobacter sp. TaxID=50741 RepID=UPI003565D003